MAMPSLDNYIEILYDIKNGGNKEITWKLHRLITMRLAQAYKRLGIPKYNRIIDCAGYLEFRRYKDNSLKLATGNFCQTRLCPTCNWRRSKKVFAQVRKIMDSFNDDYEFIFLTLTVKNISGENLSKQIDNLVAAYKTFCLRKRIKDSILGWVKCFEVTYNWEKQEFHPHFHIIMAVEKNYFKSEKYIEQDEFCLIWQSCLDVDYKPIVHIKKFTQSEKGKGKEVAEVAKYTIKSSNIMANLHGIKSYNQDIRDEVKKITDKITDDIVLTLDSALAYRRLVEYGGIFKKKHKELNLADDINDENADLVHTEADRTNKGENYEIERYRWDIGIRNYIRIDEMRYEEND